jgi:hypothetical protein
LRQPSLYVGRCKMIKMRAGVLYRSHPAWSPEKGACRLVVQPTQPASENFKTNFCNFIRSHRCLNNADIATNPIGAVATTAFSPWRHIVDSLVVLITMSIVSAQTDIVVVDSSTTLLSLLDNIIGLAVDPPSLYLDLEGVKLGRHGSISIISLYIAPTKKIYLIDIHRLGKTAFSTTNSSNQHRI